MIKNYVQALHARIQEGHAIESVLKNLDSVLRARGHSRSKASILKALIRKLERTELQEKPVLTLAQEADTPKMLPHAQHLLESTVSPRIVIDPSIVGGFVLRNQNKQIDTSYKRTLLKLYRTIIN
jgi:hypothetical protein